MKKLLLAVFLLCAALLPFSSAKATTVYYQPTPFPLYKCTGGGSCPGGSMPQDLHVVHLWDGWLPSYYYGQLFQRDTRLVVGGWGDVYETWLKFDLAGLPINPTQAALRLKSFPAGDGSTTTPFAFCKMGGSWDLSMTWSTQPSWLTCAGWYSAPTPGDWWGIDFTPWYLEWTSGTVTNNGVMLLPQYNSNNFDMFRSSRYAGDGDRPILEFTFTQPTGMPNFKMPLPGSAKWLLTGEAGGYECMGENPLPDTSHQGNNYFSLDFSPTNIKDAGGSYSSPIPVLAAAAGTVIDVGNDPNDSRGYYITLSHGNGYQTRYLHFSQHAARANGTWLAVNDTVSQGDQLGFMGNTGVGTGTHLHINFWQNGTGTSSSNLVYAVMEGLLLKSYQTECSVNGSGVPTARIRYYHSSNTPTGN